MFCIKIADLLVGIDNRYDAIKEKCKDYIVVPNRDPDICIKSTYDYLNQQIELLENENLIGHGINKSEEFLEQIESFCLHRQIYPYLPHFNAAWIHASVVEVDGYGYAFTAPSGYGKTTQSLLWLNYFGERARIINGDNPIIRIIEDKAYVFGTPFCGSEGYNHNTSVPLKGVCYLNHSLENQIIRMDPTMAFVQAIHSNQINGYMVKDNQNDMMLIWEHIVQHVPFWQLYCDQSAKAVTTAYLGMCTK